MESEDGCDGLYMLEGKKVCADEIMCSSMDKLSLCIFDDGNTKLCLTAEDCVLKKAFVFYSFAYGSHKCVTKVQCENYGFYHHPYSAIGLCRGAAPDSSVSKTKDGYECETGYLYIYNWESKCVSKEYCIYDGATVYEENTTCIKGYDCKDFGGYLYRGENGDECISAEKCLKEGWHPYSNSGECLKIDPAADGNFIERADNICSCRGYSVSKQTYQILLLYFGDTAQCVSRAKCYFGLQNIYY